MKLPVKVYVCAIAADCELGNTDVLVYPTLKQAKSDLACRLQCGITELTITEKRIVLKGKDYAKVSRVDGRSAKRRTKSAKKSRNVL